MRLEGWGGDGGIPGIDCRTVALVSPLPLPASPVKGEETVAVVRAKGEETVAAVRAKGGGDWAGRPVAGEEISRWRRLPCAPVVRRRTVLQCGKFKKEAGASPAILRLHTEKESQFT